MNLDPGTGPEDWRDKGLLANIASDLGVLAARVVREIAGGAELWGQVHADLMPDSDGNLPKSRSFE